MKIVHVDGWLEPMIHEPLQGEELSFLADVWMHESRFVQSRHAGKNCRRPWDIPLLNEELHPRRRWFVEDPIDSCVFALIFVHSCCIFM